MTRIIVMGVSGCGKSTIASKLAALAGGDYFDVDDLHPSANIEKMRNGIPLTDDDRWPWLDKVGQMLGEGEGTRVIACSALKRAYRIRIAVAVSEPVVFVFLQGSCDLLMSRMAARAGHFMPADLLDSQLAILEPPSSFENAITVSIDETPDDIAQTAWLHIQQLQV